MLKGHYENKKLKLNAPLRGNPAGTTVNIRTDKKGVPHDPYWRRRLKDAEKDNCVQIVKEANTVKANPLKAETKKKGE